mmetsp:Transcript_22318/g.51110  ORF Transcript_22318/g.51110 Transcript_22318/m.51110 type:complete len:86 (-) Transcript_22318:498-755(-)
MASAGNTPQVCQECQAPATAPATSRFQAFKEILRVAGSNVGITLDRAEVSTTDFFSLSAAMITGEVIKFDHYRGKVTLVANVASK